MEKMIYVVWKHEGGSEKDFRREKIKHPESQSYHRDYYRHRGNLGLVHKVRDTQKKERKAREHCDSAYKPRQFAQMAADDRFDPDHWHGSMACDLSIKHSKKIVTNT